MIRSRAGRQFHHSGRSPLEEAYDKAQVPARDSSQSGVLHVHLNLHHGAVVASLRQAESVLIFGVGEAMRELRNRLRRATYQVADRLDTVIDRVLEAMTA